MHAYTQMQTSELSVTSRAIQTLVFICGRSSSRWRNLPESVIWSVSSWNELSTYDNIQNHEPYHQYVWGVDAIKCLTSNYCSCHRRKGFRQLQ